MYINGINNFLHINLCDIFKNSFAYLQMSQTINFMNNAIWRFLYFLECVTLTKLSTLTKFTKLFILTNITKCVKMTKCMNFGKMLHFA